MVRGLMIAVLLGLALAPPESAQAQDAPDPATTPTPGCERGPGTDADYAYCPDRDCLEEGTDADYVYTVCRATAGEPPPRPRSKRKAVAQPLAVQPLPARSLPVTGGGPGPVGLIGLGLLLAGAGLRLRWSAGPRC